jgi:uncharacterized protein
MSLLLEKGSHLPQEIANSLMSASSDIAALQRQIELQAQVSTSDAQRILYQVVRTLNARLFPPITKLELILTEGCNLACSYCFEKNMLGYKRMPISIAEQAVDLLFDYSGKQTDVNITLFGGEPMLNFKAIEHILPYAEQKAATRGNRIRFNMTSNGTLIDAQKAEYLARHRVYVLLSIDGMAPTNDRYRVDKKGRGTFERVAAGLRHLQQTQKWIGVKITVMPSNVPNLFRDVLELRKMGVNQFLIGHATGVYWADEDMKHYAEELRQLLRWYRREKDDSLRIDEFDERADAGHSFFGCQAGRNSISVSINGEISPCSKILALDNKNLLCKLGDVCVGLTNINNRIDLVSCSKLRAACGEAGIESDYQGGCFVTNYEENKDVFVPSMAEHNFGMIKRSFCTGCSHQ